MSSAPVRGIVPQRQRRHHHHHHHHEKHHQRRHAAQHQNDCPPGDKSPGQQPAESPAKNPDSAEEKRPKVNPIFLWAAQREQRIVEVRCEDYDKRNRIKLTKTAQGWRSIPRTALTAYSTTESVTEDEGDQQERLSSSGKHEEKENDSSRERREARKLGDEDARINDANGQLDGKASNESDEDRERHRRKRRKHADIGRSKRRRTDSETEEPSTNGEEPLVSTNWKMKKRRKFDKNKKRKRLCLEEDVVARSKLEDASELKVKIKQESKKEVETLAEVKKTEEIDTTEETEFKLEMKRPERNAGSADEQKKGDNLEKLQNSRCLQPRVVLEQLHLSQLPSRVHQRLANRAEQPSAEQSETNERSDEMTENNVENSASLENESRIDPESEEAIVDKEDLQEILNMLDSNHFPISVNETKPSLIVSKDLPRNCTKLGAAILANNQKEELEKPKSECAAKRETEMTASEKRNKFGERLHVKHRVGSKSLDETIERLERSINWQKKLGSLPNVSSMEEGSSELAKEKSLETEINDKKFSRQNALRNPAYEDDKSNRDMIESTKILDALRNTPGLSISLATNGKKLDALIDANTNLSKIMSCSRSPDSQAEVAEKAGKLLPTGLTIAVPARPKTVSPALKSRVESPESTVDFSKPEQCPCETHEEDDCHSQAAEEASKNQNIFGRHSSKCHRQAPLTDYPSYYEDGKDYSINSSKIPNLKPIAPALARNSEAQAKYSNLPRYQEVEDYDEHLLEDFNSQVSPQPSGIPYSMSSRRSSSAYLERLLPSPPCSVSCSEDAKNDLTLKSILSSSNNVDSRYPDRKEPPMDLNAHCDSEISPSYDHAEERFSKEQKSESQLQQQKRNYLEVRNRRRPMSSGDVHSPFAADYVSPKRPMSAEWTVSQQRTLQNGCYPGLRYANNQKEFVKAPEAYSQPTIFLDPASQLRELIKTSGHLIPDPLLVPRDYLPLLAGAPLTEIPKLLATRPELRLPEALTRPELLRDPDLLVISLAHLQHVLDHGEGPANKTQTAPPATSFEPSSPAASVESVERIAPVEKSNDELRPKLSCKPIGKLMPAPMDLSSHHKANSHPPLLRVRSGLLKQEPEVSSTASSPDDSQLWHPLFGSQKHRQQAHEHHQQQPQQQASWHRTTLAS